MAKRMLIDAAHPEETRVVVLSGNRLEEFDFETSTKKQIRGNIYLAKVTRVEPSLQAAFVEYGGNRHGFLAFSEIHPDYYRVPVADRQAALAADRAAAEQEQEEAEVEESAGQETDDSDIIGPLRMLHESPPDEIRGALQDQVEETRSAADAEGATPKDRTLDISTPALVGEKNRAVTSEAAEAAEYQPEAASRPNEGGLVSEGSNEADPDTNHAAENSDIGDNGDHGALPVERAQDTAIETIGGDEIEEAARRRARPARHYKIQEVIKRRQIMLVQVTKEERGNKGAALTTYLSLAGRYCVLMPNTPRGGGVSRKITSVADRRRLKDLMTDLDVPDGMGVIVRTAGSERSKAEIKRDFEYLIRLWDEIRDVTLQSTAPALIYEEGNLIKRSIRDLYTRDIEEVIVDGAEGYRTAKAFMKMLMPSHAKRVKPYRDPTVPLFHRFQVESQIDLIHSPVVQLRSGGYIVIGPTEALVAIDVNSGRSTKERNIEETALKTNIEAADEIARQLRLRDLAGLVVIDFIDMEEGRNQAAVERRLKEAMRNDRARIQLGRISPFGLLELSRQRLRPSLIEASTQPCPHCNGTGTVRSTESTALHVLRAIEEEGVRRRSAEISVAVPTVVALYILNQKRATLHQAEARYGFHVTITSDDTLIPPAFRLDRLRAFTPAEIAALPPVLMEFPEFDEEDESDRIPIEEELPAEPEPGVETGAGAVPEHRDEETSGRTRRRRRRRRGEEGQPQATPSDTGRAKEGQSEIASMFGKQRLGEELSEELRVGHEEGAIPPSAEAESAGAAGGETHDAAHPEAMRIVGIEAERKRRRRGRRGGRRRRRGTPGQEGLGLNGTASEDQAGEAEGTNVGEHGEQGRDGHEHEGFGLDEAKRFVEDTAAPSCFGVVGTSEPVAETGEPPIGSSMAEMVEIASPTPPVSNAATSIEAAFSLPQATEAQVDVEIASIPVGEHGDREEIFIEPVMARAEPPAVMAPVAGRTEAPARTATQPAEEERHPVQYNIPEPHEVTGPPANPRRGWWRR